MAVWTAWALPAAAEDTRVSREGNAWVQVVSGKIAPAKTLKVITELGSVTVHGGAQQDITYTVRKRVYTGSESAARRQFDDFTVRALSRGEYVLLEGNCNEHSVRRMSIDISLTVPRDMVLVKIETQGGGVAVNGIAGKVYAGTAGGGVSINDVGGAVYARTSGGGIDVGNTGGELKLETAGGSIRIASANGTVNAQTAGGSIELGSSTAAAILETAGGSIQVKKCGGTLKASTAGGSVDVGDVAGAAVLETSGGSIRLGSANGDVRARTSGGGIRLSRLTHGVIAETAAGPITAEFIARRGEFTDSSLETSMGDVVVYLPQDLPVTVKASIDSAFGHSVHSDFSEIRVTTEGGDYGPKEVYGQGAINGGGPLLKLHTTSGNIILKRGNR
jgi:DUF4097 and DUF4098 domain-containing protein YvlB